VTQIPHGWDKWFVWLEHGYDDYDGFYTAISFRLRRPGRHVWLKWGRRFDSDNADNWKLYLADNAEVDEMSESAGN
jgi:hypothetical protein